jgi:hypothetical protein
VIDQSNEATTPSKSAPAIPKLTDVPSDRAPLDPLLDDPPDPPFVELAAAAVLDEELVTFPFPDGVADGSLLTILHEADALAVVEPGVYGR